MKQIEKSMSNGRKIFRLMKFIEDFRDLLYYIVAKKIDYYAVSNAIISLFSLFYHFLDNLVLLSNLGILDHFDDGNWKTGKDFFSLLKSSINFITLFHKLYNLLLEYRLFQEDLDEGKAYRLIDMFSYIRTNTFLLIGMFMKILIRVNSLGINPFHQFMGPAIISLCGIIYASCSLYKNLMKVQDENRKFTKMFTDEFNENTRLSGILCESNANEERDKVNPNDIERYNRSDKDFGYKSNLLGSNHNRGFSKDMGWSKKDKRYRSSKMLSDINSFEYLLTSAVPETRVNDWNYFSRYYLLEFSVDFPTSPIDGI